MNVLLVNKFFYQRGGSERVMFDTAAGLQRAGHRVGFFSMHSPRNLPSAYARHFVSEVDFSLPGARQRLRGAGRMLYSFEAKRKLAGLLRQEPFEVAHLHNVHHQISPSILHTLRRHKIPVVMTLHDYKMICPVYTMVRRGKVCELCRGGAFHHCLTNRCAKNSLPASLLNAVEMYLHHTILRLYRLVDVFVSPSLFLKNKLAEAGFPGRVVHLRNPVELSAYAPPSPAAAPSILYAGRLSPEKGLHTLLDAVKGLPAACILAGEGPLRIDLERQAASRGIDNVLFLGHVDTGRVKDLMASARAVVVPSEWYENNPLAAIEACAAGKPVIGSRIGGIPEVVEHGVTGLLFTPGSAEELRQAIIFLLENPDAARDLGWAARLFAERNLGLDRYLEQLLMHYQEAVDAHRTD
ncbi:MAG: glycosyltransferase [Candidatus Eisenbacteria bacterium]|nr:glycosyltransferase [Candidatus Eisenbacteria bacterium]